MEAKKEVRALAVVKDLRSGAGAAAMMEKYKLSEKGFRSVLRKLVAAKLLMSAEVERFHRQFPDLFVGDLRLAARVEVLFPAIVCEAGAPSCKGFLKDVSQKGIAIEGLEADVGEIKLLKILSNDMMGLSTIVLEAKCVWAEDHGRSYMEPVAGFEITSISASGMNELVKLM